VEPALPDRHFRRYPEPPELADDSSAATVSGLRKQTYAIIPTAPGTVTLPATEVVWWDVNTREARVARAPGRTMQITGAPASHDDVETADQTETSDQADRPGVASETPPPVDIDVRSDQVPWPGPGRRRALWLTVLGGLAAAAVLSWLWQRWSTASAGAHEPRSRRACWLALKRACRGGDADAIHQALLRYLRAHYQAPMAESLRQFRGAGHGDVLDALNAGLYRRQVRAALSGREVLDAVREIRRRRSRGNEPLPALYD
jgi:hypothetical protein